MFTRGGGVLCPRKEATFGAQRAGCLVRTGWLGCPGVKEEPGPVRHSDENPGPLDSVSSSVAAAVTFSS